MNPPRCTSRRRLNALSIARLMAALMDGACTAQDLAEASGLCLDTARHYVLTLHREGIAYIAQWEQNSRGVYTTPAYRLGARRDADKPRQSGAERGRAYRARRKQIALIQATAGAMQ